MVIGILEYTVYLHSGQAAASKLSESTFRAQVNNGMHTVKCNFQFSFCFM